MNLHSLAFGRGKYHHEVRFLHHFHVFLLMIIFCLIMFQKLAALFSFAMWNSLPTEPSGSVLVQGSRFVKIELFWWAFNILSFR